MKAWLWNETRRGLRWLWDRTWEAVGQVVMTVLGIIRDGIVYGLVGAIALGTGAGVTVAGVSAVQEVSGQKGPNLMEQVVNELRQIRELIEEQTE